MRWVRETEAQPTQKLKIEMTEENMNLAFYDILGQLASQPNHFSVEEKNGSVLIRGKNDNTILYATRDPEETTLLLGFISAPKSNLNRQSF